MRFLALFFVAAFMLAGCQSPINVASFILPEKPEYFAPVYPLTEKIKLRVGAFPRSGFSMAMKAYSRDKSGKIDRVYKDVTASGSMDVQPFGPDFIKISVFDEMAVASKAGRVTLRGPIHMRQIISPLGAMKGSDVDASAAKSKALKSFDFGKSDIGGIVAFPTVGVTGGDSLYLTSSEGRRLIGKIMGLTYYNNRESLLLKIDDHIEIDGNKVKFTGFTLVDRAAGIIVLSEMMGASGDGSRVAARFSITPQ